MGWPYQYSAPFCSLLKSPIASMWLNPMAKSNDLPSAYMTNAESWCSLSACPGNTLHLASRTYFLLISSLRVATLFCWFFSFPRPLRMGALRSWPFDVSTIHVFWVVISASLTALNAIYMLTTSKFMSPAWTFPLNSNDILDIPTWMSNMHLT